MDTTCLDYCLTDDERDAFEKNGFLVVEDALPPQMVEDLKAIGGGLTQNIALREGWNHMPP